ncbi:conserved phage C-terminal domain-containing protein [Candidatus Nitrospira bockiana]
MGAFALTPGGGEERARIYKDAEDVLAFLNERTGRQYPPREPRTNKPTANLELIASRLKAGYTADQCRQVIVRKVHAWKGRQTGDGVRMEDFLRPATLFGPKNFSGYVGELTLPAAADAKRGGPR